MFAVKPQCPELSLIERPKPDVGPTEVRIKVTAAGVNRADLVQAAGRYPPPKGASDVYGLEASGVIDAVGAKVRGFQVGDPVCALLSGGGYAEFVTCDHRLLMPIPKGVSLEHAATLPEVWATVWLNLMCPNRIQNKTILLHAGASGIGSAAIQLAKRAQARVLVTTGSQEKMDYCEGLGASAIHRHEDWPAQVEQLAPAGVDFILDPVAATYLAKNQRVLATDGHMVVIGLMSGRKAELDMGRLLVGRQTIAGSTLRSRPLSLRAQLCSALVEQIWPAIAAHDIKLSLDRSFPMTQAKEAHQWLADNKTQGKVWLTT